MKKIIAFAILLVGLLSCSSNTYEDIEAEPVVTTPTPGTDPVVETVSYTKNVKSIIDASCAGCHSSGGSASFLPLTSYTQVRAAVINAGLLNRIQLQNGQQGLMPQGGRMSQTNIDLIVKWNTEGLVEN
ncbi:cytochrome c [Flavobacterium sp. LS1R49]|uniref:Cytochrome c n=1 Tax=Flavobacterium shii TaxID=2987687 RepID=A0A9X3C774_9FLAO|nr:cytochrome c [Flavobacterium shii]MCV9927883.1 cytochrome c [Flavobacterium shii]